MRGREPGLGSWQGHCCPALRDACSLLRKLTLQLRRRGIHKGQEPALGHITQALYPQSQGPWCSRMKTMAPGAAGKRPPSTLCQAHGLRHLPSAQLWEGKQHHPSVFRSGSPQVTRSARKGSTSSLPGSSATSRGHYRSIWRWSFPPASNRKHGLCGSTGNGSGDPRRLQGQPSGGITCTQTCDGLSACETHSHSPPQSKTGDGGALFNTGKDADPTGCGVPAGWSFYYLNYKVKRLNIHQNKLKRLTAQVMLVDVGSEVSTSATLRGSPDLPSSDPLRF